MDFCEVHYEGDRAHIEVVYKNSHWASYAKQKLHGFEYPPGHRLIVRSEFEANAPRGSQGVDNREEIIKLAETLVQATSQMKKTGRTPGKCVKLIHQIFSRGFFHHSTPEAG